MKNIMRLFLADLKRLTSNVMTVVIVVGLVFLPSIFSWYNILACWNVFANTGNLQVAVANEDVGYQSDLLPIRVNIGDQVASSLRANDQLNWVITSESDAIDGAESGKYYAAVVIPSSFSEDMMTFYQDDSTAASILYYTNEKKNAIAPKVTGQGADAISYEVNKEFTETITEASLNIMKSLSNYLDGTDAGGRIATLATHVGTISTQMQQASNVISAYSSLLGTSEQFVTGTGQLIDQARSSSGDVASGVEDTRTAASGIGDALKSSSSALESALASDADAYASVAQSIDAAFVSADQLTSDSSSALRNEASNVDGGVARSTELRDNLSQLRTAASDLGADQAVAALDRIIDRVQASIDRQTDLRDALNRAADDIDAGASTVQDDRDAVSSLVTEARNSVNAVSSSYTDDVEPNLNALLSDVGVIADALGSSADGLDAAAADLSGQTDSVNAALDRAQTALDASAQSLSNSASDLSSLSNQLLTALAQGDNETVRALLSSDISSLSNALAAPVELDRIAVFSASSFGSQMAPLYTTLALWIGSLLLLVAVKPRVSKKERAELDDPKPWQMFFGRFGCLSLMSTMQTVLMTLGNLLFLGVQAVHPLFYLLCMWVSGQVFTFIIYALVLSFANLGKAIAVLFLIMQVTAGGGSFPLQLMPKPFLWVSPYMPARHTIDAMRAAMMGIYQNDYWFAMGKLVLFLIPAALLGLALRKPLERFLQWYLRQVDASKLAS